MKRRSSETGRKFLCTDIFHWHSWSISKEHLNIILEPFFSWKFFVALQRRISQDSSLSKSYLRDSCYLLSSSWALNEPLNRWNIFLSVFSFLHITHSQHPDDHQSVVPFRKSGLARVRRIQVNYTPSRSSIRKLLKGKRIRWRTRSKYSEGELTRKFLFLIQPIQKNSTQSY